jgi:hypothetical protein
MNKKHNLTIFAIIVGLVFGLWYMSTSRQLSHNAGIDAKQATIGEVSFAYPSHYGVYEKVNSPYTKALNTVVWYENTIPNQNFFAGKTPSPSEPPTALSLDIFANEKNSSPKEFLMSDRPYMFGKGDGVSVTINGKQGLVLDWDGLYRGKSVVFNHDGKLYIFSVTYNSPQDEMVRNFDLMMGSVSFK